MNDRKSGKKKKGEENESRKKRSGNTVEPQSLEMAAGV